MKKVFLILLTISVSCCCTYAQIGEKPSWWKTGELRSDSTAKRNVTASDKTSSKMDSTLQVSVKESLFILRQDYSLYDKRKKRLYGFNGEDQFGRIYSIGIKCNNFNIILDQAVHPWAYDEKYNQFKSKKLVPTITDSKYMSLGDSSATNRYNNLDSIVTPDRILKEQTLYMSKPFTSAQEGMEINTSDTCYSGYIVWVIKESGSLELGNAKFGLKFVKTNLDMVGTVSFTPPNDSVEVLGCLFVTSNENDSSKLYLSGIATENNNRWTLCFPFKDFYSHKKSAKENAPSTKGRLTEIKKNSSK